MLTGVRGVGKTTTARIIARALNCIGPDGKGGPTAEPCGVCEHCRAIAEDRHVDVIEMDAASRTGVDDIRELIEGVRYRPVTARYKVYIIDEVHMLSTSAFNALLKTLEEPPEHVNFIFATTEIRKVPVTVLSRCQRFDLRRVDQRRCWPRHFARDRREGGRGGRAPSALALIARAADGSVRDGLSLLDQAIALAARRGRRGDGARHAGPRRPGPHLRPVRGGDAAATSPRRWTCWPSTTPPAPIPLVVLQDLLDLTHWLTRVKMVPGAGRRSGRARGRARARPRRWPRALSMPVLARAWQMLLKGLGEVQQRAARRCRRPRWCWCASPMPPSCRARRAGAKPGDARRQGATGVRGRARRQGRPRRRP